MTKRLSFLAMTLWLPLLLGALLFVSKRVQAGSPDVCAICTYPTIQDAATNGPENTLLTIGAGTFFENVEITRSVIFQGAGPGITIIDGQVTDTAVLVSGPVTVSISELTIQNGDTTSLDGGGVLNESGIVTLSNVVVENNRALSGAGITNDGTMILDGVIVRNNVADEVVANISICEDCAGGGIYNLSVMTITNSTIHGNTAKYGGGIDNAFMGSLVLTNVEVYGNTAQNNPGDPDSAGGGIENLGMMTITSSTVRNNEAPVGGGIANDGTLTVGGSDVHSNSATARGGGIHNAFNLTVQTSNIHGNQAGSGGGGISSEAGDVVVARTAVYNNIATSFGGGGILNDVPPAAGSNSFAITNSTLSGNSTNGSGGGLRNGGIATTSLNNVTLRNNTAVVRDGQAVVVSAGSLTTRNSLISSTGVDCSGTITSLGYNITSDSCGLSGTADLVNANLLLGPLQDNGGGTLTHALLLGSPAINSGNNASCPAVDQRGVSRPVGPTCDRGAYEFDGVTRSLYLPLVVRP
jgi:hypothetical protein